MGMRVISHIMLLIVLLDIKSCVEEEATCENGSCETSYTKDHEKLKYIRKGRWEKYYDLIDEAMANHKECSSADCYTLQRRKDFKEWVNNGGITKEQFLNAKARRLGTHYQIIDHKLYREEKCIFEARCNGNEHFILNIIQHLPDMEFIVNTHDWPKIRKWEHDLTAVFSFSKTPDDRDILYPAWTFWEGGPAVWPIFPTGLGRWDLMSESLNKTAKEWPWERKHNIAFFRGSRTSAERDPLILLSRDKPCLANAQYTKNQAWKSPADTLNLPAAEPVSMEEHCHYKYLFNFRGVAASFRFKHLFLCQSLVFHVGEEWVEFFYSEMKPWVHYIPVSTDLKNVQELIEFAVENDDIARAVAQRGHDFIVKHLKMRDVENYWLKILKRYAKLMKWTISRDQTLKEITRKT